MSAHLATASFALMTAAERHGARIALEAMRLHGARLEMSGRLIGSTDASPVPRGELLQHTGRMVQIVADLAELSLDCAAGASVIHLPNPPAKSG